MRKTSGWVLYIFVVYISLEGVFSYGLYLLRDFNALFVRPSLSQRHRSIVRSFVSDTTGYITYSSCLG